MRRTFSIIEDVLCVLYIVGEIVHYFFLKDNPLIETLTLVFLILFIVSVFVHFFAILKEEHFSISRVLKKNKFALLIASIPLSFILLLIITVLIISLFS